MIEESFIFPHEAIFLGNAFLAKNEGRPILFHMQVTIAGGKMTCLAADGFCAGRMTTEVERWPHRRYDDGEEPTAIPDMRFFLSRPQLDVLRAMPRLYNVGGVILQRTATGRVRLGNPLLDAWVNDANVVGEYPDLSSILNVQEKKLPGLTVSPEIMARINTFAKRVGADWIHLKAASETTAIAVDITANKAFPQDYALVLMPMVRSKN